jgi:2-polyprenyl-3-methyl-5-hydroxy-6-metoxy-1,4-benzoquinol methylase
MENSLVYEDFVGTTDGGGQEHFDSSEFAIRVDIEDHHYWHVHRRRVILDELRAFGPSPNGLLLELGCGIGTVATHLNANGYRVDYSDVFVSALEFASKGARRRLGEAARERRFLRVDALRSVPRLGYTGMLMFDVIEHLPDDERVLRNVHAALSDSPDSFVMITVPAFEMLWSPWDDIERHERRYTRPQLVALLDRCGFSVERSTYFFGPFFFAALGMKCVRWVRDAVAGPAPPEVITDLVESRTTESLNRLMLGALSMEQRWLAGRTLPLGTSILVIARRR